MPAMPWNSASSVPPPTIIGINNFFERSAATFQMDPSEHFKLKMTRTAQTRDTLLVQKLMWIQAVTFADKTKALSSIPVFSSERSMRIGW
jgi:hypothetical protein